MISFRKINALWSKNLKNFMNNPFVALTPIVVIGITWLNYNTLPDGYTYDQAGMLLMLGVVMNIVLVGAFTIACLIAEEKEKNTLNVLITSTVSVLDFLTAKVLTAATVTVAVNVILYFIIYMESLPVLEYLIITTLGAIAAIIMGASLGLLAKNQATASVLATPLMIPIFLPLFLPDNEFVQNIMYYLFTEQVIFAVRDVAAEGALPLFRLGIIGINIVVFTAIFAICYKKRGLNT